MKKERKDYLKSCQLYKDLTEKLYTKHLNNIDKLQELPLYDELDIVKTSKVFIVLKS